MTYLLDTNVVSESRRLRPDPAVLAWLHRAEPDRLHTSVVVIGELRRGVENVRPRDHRAAQRLDLWLDKVVHGFGARVLPITTAVAERWGRADVPRRHPTADALIAATAVVHGLTVVTRNVKAFAESGAPVLNPFS